MSTTRPPSFEERYAAPVEASRRGAHRARPNPLTAALPVIAGMAVVLLVTVGAFTLLSSRGNPSSSPSSVIAGAPTATEPASPQPSAPESAATPTSTPSETPEESETEPAAEVDKSAELIVLNSTSVSGLAKEVADTLEDKGWTVGDTSNASDPLSTTRVYYADDEDAATAKAVAAALGYGKAKRSAAKAEDGITVVLGRDAT